jgi:hypothetical protein
MGVLGISAPAIATSVTHQQGAQHATGDSHARPALPTGQYYACPPARPGHMTCMSVRTTQHWSAISAAAPTISNGPYGPADLRHAYRLVKASPTRGKGKLVAIVDAFSDPNAASDLAHFRNIFHLPPCTRANGCLHIVNQNGKRSPLPRPRADWAGEISLDLDMVSAICPKCHILLVEASNDLTSNLGIAVNRAVRMGAKFVSNSWGSSEFRGENHFSHFFNHPGHVIAFASGDFGFGPTFPADLQYVTSIGGTRLVHANTSRGWSEGVWGQTPSDPQHATASGCSHGQAKPSWQLVDAKPGGCFTRTENDVAAVADPATGVKVYDSFGTSTPFQVFGGTSASTPIITGIYALAGHPKVRTYPAQYSYIRHGNLFDVKSGTNGTCSSRKYLCTGIGGFDGPTGFGTPNGIRAFGVRTGRMVTVVDPGRQAGARGNSFFVKIIGLDSRRVSSLRYTATGLPRGLSVSSIRGSTNGKITGVLRAAVGVYHVAVTAHDGTVKGTTHFNIVVR